MIFILPAHSKLKLIGKGKGNFLSYSYDKNMLYGEKVELQLWDWIFKGERIFVDFDRNVLAIMGDVEVEREGKRVRGDELRFSILLKKFYVINYREIVEKKYFDENFNEELVSEVSFEMREIDASIISNSFLYYTFSSMEILENLRIIGYEVTSHLEGIPSIPLGKFVVKKGTINIGSGVRVGKVWYSNSQGAVMDVSAVIKRKGNDLSTTFLTYEEKSFIKDSEKNRVFRLRNTNRLPLGKNWEGSLTANFDSLSSWNTNLTFSRITPNSSSFLSLYHFKSFSNIPSETWLKAETMLNFLKFGNINFSLGYEEKGQFLSSLSYSKKIYKSIIFSSSTSYNFIKKRGEFEGSNLFSGNFALKFTPHFFSLSSNYSLNRDLISGNTLTVPSLNFELSPIFLYFKLIQINISNSFYYNIWKETGLKRTDYTDNLVFNLSTNLNTIPLLRNLSFNYRLEHLWRGKGEEFLTSGASFHLQKFFLKNSLNLSLIYNFHTRRRTKGWFIEGSNFESISLFLHIKPTQPFNINVSVNGDPKRGLVNSFSNLNYSLGRSWFLEVNGNYNFLIEKLENMEAYLIKDTEKFSIRIGWRLLGKQLFVDLLPK